MIPLDASHEPQHLQNLGSVQFDHFSSLFLFSLSSLFFLLKHFTHLRLRLASFCSRRIEVLTLVFSHSQRTPPTRKTSQGPVATDEMAATPNTIPQVPVADGGPDQAPSPALAPDPRPPPEPTNETFVVQLFDGKYNSAVVSKASRN